MSGVEEMISVRENVFESNSSSCHSLSLSGISPEKLVAFNNGELYYLDAGQDKGFFTAEEVVRKFKQIVPEVDDVDITGFSTFTGDINVWDSIPSDYADASNFVHWILENLNVEMLEWAFDKNDTTPKYFSKKIIKTTLQKIAESVWYSPLYKIDDFFDYNGNICGVYDTDGSDIIVEPHAQKLLPYKQAAKKDSFNLEIEFRH